MLNACAVSLAPVQQGWTAQVVTVAVRAWIMERPCATGSSQRESSYRI